MATKQKCMIIGASPITSDAVFKQYNLSEYFIICADGGYETAAKFGIKPDLVVGDFDSSTKHPPKHVKVQELPVEKDVTDTMFAAMKGLTQHCMSFVLLGCLGGDRFDHSIANLEVLQFLLSHGATGVLEDETTSVLLLSNNRLRLTKMVGDTVSVFPYNGSSCEVSYQGLKYPLEKESLTCGGTLMGVSNSIVSDYAEIRVHSGTAMIILYRERKEK